METIRELDDFLASWVVDPLHMKDVFLEYRDLLDGDGVTFSFKGRPNVSYSLRARHSRQKDRELFILIDVIDDEPENRWLSVCFYDDMVQDPEDLGDFVPAGLLGSDARCFSLDEESAEQRAYVADRIREAKTAAAAD